MRTCILLIAVLIGASVVARAGDDVAAAQSVIKSQEEAFGRDDAAAAYAFAAPGDPKLLSKSRRLHVHGAQRLCSGLSSPQLRVRARPGSSTARSCKMVQIVDADGQAWDALYTLEPQSDGSLKISACILKKAVTS